MSNVGNTNPMEVDPLDAMVERLNRSVAKVSKLRLSLDELESELSQIHQQCENAIRSRAPVTSAHKAQIVVDHIKSRGAPITQSPHSHGRKIPPSPVSPQTLERKPLRSSIRTTRGQTSELRDLQRQKRKESPRSVPKSNPARQVAGPSMKNQSKDHSDSPSFIPSRVSVAQGSPGIAGEKDDHLYSQSRTALAEAEVQGDGTLVLRHSHAENLPIAQRGPASQPPRPPTNLFPFPKDINPSSYPPELKHEGDDWFVLFNPSPKVKRALDVNLVHDLVHGNQVNCIRFSQDGKLLATGCARTAEIYNVKTGARTCVFDHARNVYVWNVCFSPNGRYLATGSMDNRMRIWNIAKRQIHSFDRHPATISSLDFSPNGQFLVSGSHDGSVRLWDVRGGALRVLTIEDHYLPDKHYNVLSVAISSDGRYLAVGSHYAIVSIWELPTGMLVQRLRGHSNFVSSVAFTPDGKGLMSMGLDHSLKYWDMSGLYTCSGASTAPTSISSTSSSPCLMNITSTDRINSIAISNDGAWVVSGSDDGKVLFWDTRTGIMQCMLSGHKKVVNQADMSPVGNYLATASDDGHVRIWSYGDIPKFI